MRTHAKTATTIAGLLTIATLAACGDSGAGFIPTADGDTNARDTDAGDTEDAGGVLGRNFRHIWIWDFGRGRDYIGDFADRETAVDFFAAHVDVTEVASPEAAAALRARNPDIRVFGYDLDLTACKHERCGSPDAPPLDDPPGAAESYYLHFSEDTELRLSFVDGTTRDVLVPGCVDDIGPDCRVQVAVWLDVRWVYYPGDAGFRTWMAERLLANAELYDGAFLDEHGPGLATTDIVLSGGGILEYGGRTRQDAAADFNADLVEALSEYQRVFAARDKFIAINGANWSLRHPLVIDQVAAAKGVVMEFQHRVDAFDGVSDYGAALANVDRLVQAGALIDLYDAPCRDLVAFDYTSAGLYSSPFARWQMWRLASYYMMREMPEGEPGTGRVFFDPNLCTNFLEPERALDFIDEWLLAYEFDLGDPDGPRDAGPFARGPSGAVCEGEASEAIYGVLSRSYDDGDTLVLVRPRDRWDCVGYGDDTAATLELPSAMRLLLDDGSFAPASSTIDLRNGEAAILVR